MGINLSFKQYLKQKWENESILDKESIKKDVILGWNEVTKEMIVDSFVKGMPFLAEIN